MTRFFPMLFDGRFIVGLSSWIVLFASGIPRSFALPHICEVAIFADITLYTIPGVLSSSFLSFGILKTLESGLDRLNTTLMLALLTVRLMRSDTPSTSGKTAKRSGSFSVVVFFWIFFCTFWINFRLYPLTSVHYRLSPLPVFVASH